jgi:hypothetical protein
VTEARSSRRIIFFFGIEGGAKRGGEEAARRGGEEATGRGEDQRRPLPVTLSGEAPPPSCLQFLINMMVYCFSDAC